MRNLTNQIYEAFDSVHAERVLKEKTGRYLVEKSTARHIRAVRCAAAVLVLLFVLTGAGGYAFYMTPVAAISIDINPSMEWEINRLDRVVSVICYNEAAENAAAKLHLKHRKYDEAIDELLSSAEMSGYLSEDSTVNFSVASEDADRSARMQDRAEECAGHYCENVSCHAGSTQDRQEANEAGVSLGKYQAFLILQESDPAITLEEVSKMHMCEIRHLIEEYNAGDVEAGQTDTQDMDNEDEGNENGDDAHNCSEGHGSRHGHHHGGN